MYSNFMHSALKKKVALDNRKACRSLPDLATTNVCKVDTSNRNHTERSRWMKFADHQALAEEISINLNTLWKWLIGSPPLPAFVGFTSMRFYNNSVMLILEQTSLVMHWNLWIFLVLIASDEWCHSPALSNALSKAGGHFAYMLVVARWGKPLVSFVDVDINLLLTECAWNLNTLQNSPTAPNWNIAKHN